MPQKRTFRSEKKWTQHWISHTRISLSTKLQPKLTILIFWTKFVQKRYFRLKTDKVNSLLNSADLNPNFNLNWQFWPLGPNLPKKGICGRKQKTSASPLNCDIRITLGTKFQFKLTILIFWTKFTPKKVYSIKNGKSKHTIEFCIFKLALVPNYNSNGAYHWWTRRAI